MHSKYKEGCRDKGFASVIQTNPSFAQQEYGNSIILPSNSIAAIVRVQRCAYKEEDALGIISNNIN